MTSTAAVPVTLLHRLAGWVGWAYLQLVGRTSFVLPDDDPAALSLRRDRRPAIYAFWHNTQVFLSYEHRGEGVSILVSQSRDGEYIAQVMRRMGLLAVRGSSSRGGRAALREMCDRLAAGGQVGFTPDGPKGPVQTIRGGVLFAARTSGRPIIPTSLVSRRRVEFRSWDRFFIPLPFSTIAVIHGAPLLIPADITDEEAAERLRVALNDATERGRRLVTEAPSWLVSLLVRCAVGFWAVLVALLLPVAVPVAGFAYGWRRAVRGLSERLAFGAPAAGAADRRVWFHAASVGEWRALRPVLDAFRRRGEAGAVVTVTTPEARAIVGRELTDVPVRLLPADAPGPLHRWFRRVRPRALVIIETEMWPLLFRTARRRRVPIVIANARMSARSHRAWSRVRPLARFVLRGVSLVLARAAEDGDRFRSLGVSPERVIVTGNTKFDNVAVDEEIDRARERAALFGSPTGPIIVAGSTWPGEEEALLTFLSSPARGNASLVIAPRRAARFDEVAALIERSGRRWARWSALREAPASFGDVLLVDTLGDLGRLYRAADVAFVGGSLVPHGGQNPVEPAALGVPVVFGPDMTNFLGESNGLLAAGGARRAADAADLASTLGALVANERERREAGRLAAGWVRAQQGAAARTAEAIARVVGEW